ncbi:MAG: tetratricopeptide repeat protein [Anaerolineaceae bacterium]|nr:tetratricopeptide repeat protein [Anaerolineaceae bacterium]
MTGIQDKFQNAMDQGHSAAWDQKWAFAADFYRQALYEFPENPSALNSLGLAMFELGEFEEALIHYQRASKISPEDPVPLEKMARIFERLGRLQEAIQASANAADLYMQTKEVDKSIESWERILSLRPAHLMARTRLAMIYERMGKKEKAIIEYLATASIMQHAGNSDRATQVIEYCLRLEPDNSDVKNSLAKLRSNQLLPKPTRPRGGTGPVRMANVKLLEETKVLEKKTQNPVDEARQKGLVLLASLLFDQLETEPSSESMSRRGISDITRGTAPLSLNRDQNKTRITLHISQAIDSETKGDATQSIKELESALEVGLDHPAAFYILGINLIQNNPKKAMKYLKKSFKHPDFALGSHIVIATIQHTEKDYQNAAISFLRALGLADAATISQKYADEVRQLYEPIIETQTHKGSEEGYKKICRAISSQLLRSDWRHYLISARQQMPVQDDGIPPAPLAELLLEIGSSEIVEALAHIRQLSAQNKHHSAMEEAFYIIENAPTYLPLHVQIGELLLKEGRNQEAVDKFIMLSELYNIRGEASQGIRLLNRVSTLMPMNPQVRAKLVEMLTAQGHIEEAIKQYNELADTHYNLAELDNARDTYESALRLAQKSDVDRSLQIEILYKIADIDMQRLEMRNAVRVFEQIRTLEPEDFKARAKIIDIYFRLGQDSTAITELDSFTSILENSGKRASAIEFLNEIIPEIPNKLDLRKRLADLYVRDGKVSNAVKQLDAIADALLNAENVHGAITMINAIIALNPPNAADYKQILAQLSNRRT